MVWRNHRKYGKNFNSHYKKGKTEDLNTTLNTLLHSFELYSLHISRKYFLTVSTFCVLILKGSRVSLKPFMLVRASPFLRLRSDRRVVSAQRRESWWPQRKTPMLRGLSDFVESQRTISYKKKSNSDY